MSRGAQVQSTDSDVAHPRFRTRSETASALGGRCFLLLARDPTLLPHQHTHTHTQMFAHGMYQSKHCSIFFIWGTKCRTKPQSGPRQYSLLRVVFGHNFNDCVVFCDRLVLPQPPPIHPCPSRSRSTSQQKTPFTFSIRKVLFEFAGEHGGESAESVKRKG